MDKKGAHDRAAHEGALDVLRTAELLRQQVSDVVGARGLTLQQFNVLRILRGAGSPVPTLDVGERMIERAPGVTRLLDRMEGKGLVIRERCPRDRRRVLVRITPTGAAVLARLDAPVTTAESRIMGALADTELRALSRALRRVQARSSPQDGPGGDSPAHNTRSGTAARRMARKGEKSR